MRGIWATLPTRPDVRADRRRQPECAPLPLGEHELLARRDEEVAAVRVRRRPRAERRQRAERLKRKRGKRQVAGGAKQVAVL